MPGKRVTLYLKREDLLEWVRRYTGKESLSEAVTAALAELQAMVAQRRAEVLDRFRGIWAGDPEIAAAFRELDEGWQEWRRRLEDS